MNTFNSESLLQRDSFIELDARSRARIADDLASNLARQVHWHDTARLAWERGARLAVEMPSGSVLTNLTMPVFIDGQAISCDNTKMDTVLALIARQQRS